MTLAINPRLLTLTSIFFLGASSSICYPPFLRAEAQSGSSANQFTVPNGQLTFDSEGLECPNLSDKCKLYHSRIPHVPSEQSGVTIGRGYDLKRKEPDKIKKDLIAAGLSNQIAEAYSRAGCKLLSSGKCEPQYTGKKAREFINSNKHNLPEITPEQQRKLFAITYSEIKDDVKRISNSAKDGKGNYYGTVNFENLNPKILDALIDLRYRGDYTPKTRELIQKHLVNNDMVAFQNAMMNDYWTTKSQPVPLDRFNRRLLYLGVQKERPGCQATVNKVLAAMRSAGAKNTSYSVSRKSAEQYSGNPTDRSDQIIFSLKDSSSQGYQPIAQSLMRSPKMQAQANNIATNCGNTAIISFGVYGTDNFHSYFVGASGEATPQRCAAWDRSKKLTPWGEGICE